MMDKTQLNSAAGTACCVSSAAMNMACLPALTAAID